MTNNIKEEMSPETRRMFDVCDQYCDGKINLKQAIEKYREFIPSADDEELEILLTGFQRDNVVKFPKS